MINKREEPLNFKLTVPITWTQKETAEHLKHHNVDVNEMIRSYLDAIIKKLQSGEIEGVPTR